MELKNKKVLVTGSEGFISFGLLSGYFCFLGKFGNYNFGLIDKVFGGRKEGICKISQNTIF